MEATVIKSKPGQPSLLLVLSQLNTKLKNDALFRFSLKRAPLRHVLGISNLICHFYVKQKVNQIIYLNLSCIPLITPIFCIKVGLNGTKLHRCVMLMLTKPSATINEMTALELQRGFVTWCESYPT